MIAALLLALGVAAAPATCPVERAAYRLRGQPGFTAEFHPVPTNVDWPLGIALAIHAAKTARTYWFLPWNGGTDGRLHLRWVRVSGDRLDGKSIALDQDLLLIDQNNDFIARVPPRGGEAPARFVVPGFARQLWYATVVDERDSMTQAFFELGSCAAQSNTRAEVELPPVG